MQVARGASKSPAQAETGAGRFETNATYESAYRHANCRKARFREVLISCFFDVRSLLSFRTLRNVKLNFLSFFQGLKSVH